jgi:APA family basic amino acid/polyamine antiporter
MGDAMKPGSLFRRKTLDHLIGESTEPGRQLRRVLGPFQLTMLGVGAIIGAGIFSTVGTAAAGADNHPGAGPALIISFLLVAVACGFAALCYSEFAAMVPVSGSAYTYAYATFGELAAWLIGWDLILEYAISNAAVAVSWSAYFQTLLDTCGVHIPAWLGTDYRSALQAAGKVLTHTGPEALSPDVLFGADAWNHAPRLLGLRLIFNAPAFVIVALITWVVLVGIKETSRFNTAFVIGKLAIVAFFLGLGAMHIQPSNWVPFAPNGFAGITAASAILFFAYIGFDAVSTAAEETRNPQKDMPIAIISSLIICTVIYVAVAVVLTGIVKWDTLGVADPLSAAFNSLGMKWTAGIIALGAVMATTSALIPYQAGQPRIFFAMGRDGLLPKWAARVHPRFRTPHVTILITGVLVAVCSSVANINELVELTNIGTLFAFILVAGGIIVLRVIDPDRPRPFRTPWVPFVPAAAMVSCLYLMMQLPLISWIRFFGWMGVGLVLYYFYGFWHSRLHDAHSLPPKLNRETPVPPTQTGKEL